MKTMNSRRFSVMKNANLQAVHDDDLQSLLTSLGVYDDVINGKCLCQYCGQVITLDNLGALIPCEGRIVFTCNEHSCIIKMAESGEKA